MQSRTDPANRFMAAQQGARDRFYNQYNPLLRLDIEVWTSIPD
jgi:hypothetical protein